jgi:hypothetical protein
MLLAGRSISRSIAFALIGAVVAFWLTARAQDVPPPPKPKDEGPSLEATMKFIQDQLNGQGNVSTIHTIHDSLKGEDSGPWKYSWEISDVAPDIQGCQMSWREVHIWPNRYWSNWDSRLSLPLRDVSRLDVLPLRDHYNRGAAKRGQPEHVSDVNPEVYAAVVYMSQGKSVLARIHKSQGEKDPTDEDVRWTDVQIQFREEQLAQRVAKALVHAVELCGGGNKDPF